MKWISNFLNKIRFGKNIRSDIYIENIARDKRGRWVTDNEGKFVYKNDDPARIAKFTKAQEKRYDDLEKSPTTKCCGGECKCKSPKEIKIEDKTAPVKKPATKKAATPTKPTAKKPAPKKK